MHTTTQYIPDGETDWVDFVTAYGLKAMEQEVNRFSSMVAEEPYSPHRIIDTDGVTLIEYQPLTVKDCLIPQTELVSGGFVPLFYYEGEYQLLQEWYRFNPDDHEGAVRWVQNLAAGGTVSGFLYELHGQPFTESELVELYDRLKLTAREGCAQYREGGGDLRGSMRCLSSFTQGWSAHGHFAAEALALGAWTLAGNMAEYWASWHPTDGEEAP